MSPSKQNSTGAGPSVSSPAWLFAVLVLLGVAFGVGRWSTPSRDVDPPESGPSGSIAEDAGAEVVLSPENLKLADLGVEVARMRPVSRSLIVNGTVTFDPARVVTIAPPAAGRVVAVTVTAGDRVTAGQVLSRVDSTELAAAQAELHHAQHSLEFARDALKRRKQMASLGALDRPQAEEQRARASAADGEQQRLRRQHAAVRAAVDSATSEVETARADLAARQAEVGEARGNLEEAAAAEMELRAAITQAESAAGLARSRFERAERLLQQELLSRQDWEQARAESARAVVAVESARAALLRGRSRTESQRSAVQAAEARVAAAQSRVRSAISGVTAATARTEEVEAQLQAATRAAELARSGSEREDKVLDSGLRARQDVQAAEANVIDWEHDLEAAEHRVRLLGGIPGAGSVLTIVSPLAARVAKRLASVGDMVASDHPILTLQNLDVVWVELHVPQAEAGLLRPGLPVGLGTADQTGFPIAGRILSVSGALDEATRTVTARCAVGNSERKLRPGSFVRAEIRGLRIERGLTLPNDALQYLHGKPVVFIRLGEGRFQARPVETGARQDGRLLIRTGLRPGEQVVTRNAFQVKSQAMKAELAEE